MNRPEASIAVVEQIRSKIVSLVNETTDFSLCSGLCGMLLFLTEYQRLGLGDCSSAIEKGIDRIYTHVSGDRRPKIGFFGGVTGIAYGLEYIATTLGIEESAQIAKPIDALILEILRSEGKWAGHYDLVSGILGIGVYGFCRADDQARRAISRQVVARLLEIAEQEGSWLRWRTGPAFLGFESNLDLFPRGNLNLGLAHGNPGVLTFLANVHLAGLDALQEPILHVANWLRSTRKGNGGPGDSEYSYVAEDPIHSRLAWCYGDPGVALSLLKAGRALGDAGMREFGREIGRAAALRSPDSALVSDPALCHGSLGISLMFDRLNREAPDRLFGDAQEYWLETSLRRLTHDISLHAELSIGALDGWASVGLCLLDLCVDDARERSWSGWLLI